MVANSSWLEGAMVTLVPTHRCLVSYAAVVEREGQR